MSEPGTSSPIAGPAIRNSIPDCIEMSPCGNFAMFHHSTRVPFIAWFHTTAWYKDQPHSQVPLFTSYPKASLLWETFDEIAHKDSGQCKLLCRKCQKVIEHPRTRNQGGTSGMQSHLQSSQCQKSAPHSGQQSQISLQMSIQSGNVSPFFKNIPIR